ncbi:MULTISPECIES: hypothetical protein [unclassified Nocardia]|uniref:hypothetical protein n=1 Tax=unclassified Nocardia TaxID=2637762 RepID=UPI00278C029B|nr:MULTISPECIES: hypothetical protein [unclassified Nocardia]
MTALENDLNATIAAAVNARIEAAVAAALSGDEVLGSYVSAALNQPIEVSQGYGRTRKTTFLKHTLDKALQTAAQEAVRTTLTDLLPQLEAAVRAELHRSTDALAAQLVGSVSKHLEAPYGIKVELRFPERH